MTSARCVRKAVAKSGGVESVEGECWTCWSSVAMRMVEYVGLRVRARCGTAPGHVPEADGAKHRRPLRLHQQHGRDPSCICIALFVARSFHHLWNSASGLVNLMTTTSPCVPNCLRDDARSTKYTASDLAVRLKYCMQLQHCDRSASVPS